MKPVSLQPTKGLSNKRRTCYFDVSLVKGQKGAKAAKMIIVGKIHRVVRTPGLQVTGDR